MKLSELRKSFHEELCKNLIRIKRNKKKGDYPNNADGDSGISVKIAWEIINQVCKKPKFGNLSGQSAGKIFENITRNYIEQSFALLNHLRPGKWHYFVESEISKFEQYKDLAEIEAALKLNKQLAPSFGRDYIIKSDIIIGREPIADDEINRHNTILAEQNEIASLTPFRARNYQNPKQFLHASISCKWTLRSDRAQNIRTEAVNLIKYRKGKLPHIVAVTAEPTLTRIASLALGTGDLDCVYHFAFYELVAALKKIKDESQIDMFNMLVEGRRLRDISDLPFDLAI